MLFICGCRITTPPNGLPWDNEGFVVCPAHRLRRYGWRTLPVDLKTGHPDFNFAGYTPLELERFMVFGEKPVRSPLKIAAVMTDNRDNRDPEEIGREILAGSNGHQ